MTSSRDVIITKIVDFRMLESQNAFIYITIKAKNWLSVYHNSSFIMIDYTVHCRISIYNKMTYSQTTALTSLTNNTKDFKL